MGKTGGDGQLREGERWRWGMAAGQEGWKRGEKKGRRNLAPTVISESRRLCVRDAIASSQSGG